MTSPPDERASGPTPPADPDPSPTSSSPECTNCGTPIADTYCGTCGQRAANRIVPLWQVTNELLEDLFDLDLRVLRTLPTFFLRPGRLTVEYVQGRRRRYIRPLRLYLFSSFLLFTVLAFTSLDGLSFVSAPFTEASQADVTAARAELEALRAGLSGRGATGAPGDSATPSPLRSGGLGNTERAELQRVDDALAAVESLLATPGPTTGDSAGAVRAGPSAPQEQPPPPKIVRLLRDPGAFVDKMLDRAPYLMFLLVPTFALLLKGLYLRRGRLYLEHLIFALHVHALAFIAFALSVGLGALDAGTALQLDWWLAVSPFAYLFVAMRHVYGQSLLSTLNKMTVLLIAYGIILAGGVVVLVVATVPFV